VVGALRVIGAAAFRRTALREWLLPRFCLICARSDIFFGLSALQGPAALSSVGQHDMCHVQQLANASCAAHVAALRTQRLELRELSSVHYRVCRQLVCKRTDMLFL
jgi:hypothetical protein